MKPIYLQRVGGEVNGEMIWTTWRIIDQKKFFSCLEWLEQTRNTETGRYQLMIADERDGYRGGSLLIEGCDPMQTFNFNADFNVNAVCTAPSHDVTGKLNAGSTPTRKTVTLEEKNSDG